MHWADSEGLQKIVDGLKAAAPHMGEDFSFSQLLLDKAGNGEKFTGR
jgi:3-hydroxyacyl-CoA dehydrogenase